MLLRALCLRPALRTPLRTLATLFGIAAGIAALVSTRSASRAAVEALRGGVQDLAGPALLEVSFPGGLAFEERARIAAAAPAVRALPVVDELALCPALDDTLRLIGVDFAAELEAGRAALAAPEVLRAGTPLPTVARTLAGEGVWIPRALGTRLGLAVGGELELVLRAQRVGLEVLGLFDPPTDSALFERVVVLQAARAAELCRRPGRATRFELVPRGPLDAAASAELTGELTRELRAALPAAWRIAAPAERASESAALVDTLDFHLDVLALVSLWVGCVLVAISLATSVVQRRALLALLLSLGASRAQLARALAWEALLFGLVGGALGVGLGHALARVSVDGVRATTATLVGAQPAGRPTLSWDDVLLGLGLGAVTALVASLLPILEARRAPPLQDLRRAHPELLSARSRRRALATCALLLGLALALLQLPPVDTYPLAAIGAAFVLQFALLALLGPLFDHVGRLALAWQATTRAALVLRLAVGALASGRRRAAWAAGAVAIAVTLSVAIATLVGSFRASVDSLVTQAFSAELWIRPPQGALGGPVGTLDARVLERALAVFGAEHVDPYHVSEARVGGASVKLSGAQFEVLRREGLLVAADGRPISELFERAWSRGEALVNESCALRFGLAPGDRLRFEVVGRAVELPVAGVLRDYGDSRGEIIVDRARFLEWMPEVGPVNLAVFLPAGESVGAARARWQAACEPDWRLEVYSGAEMRAGALQVFDRSFAITRGLEGVAATIAVIAVLTVLFALLRERAAEVGLLRALGAGRAELGLSLGLQAALLGLVGGLLGCLAGLATGWILVEYVQVQSFRWTMDFAVPWLGIAETLGVLTLICAVAGLWPAAVAWRWPPAALLRGDD